MDQNPYAAPQASIELAHAHGGGGSSGPQPWDIGEVLSQAWSLFKQHWAVLVGALVVGYLVLFVPGRIVQGIGAAVAGGSGDPTGAVVGAILGMIVQLVAQSFVQIGWARMWLAAVRGENVEFGTLFSGGPRFVTMLGVTFLSMIGMYLGLILLIVPGVILAIGLSLASFYAADTNMGAIDCLKASWEATKGQKLSLFGFFIVGGIVAMLGMLACFVGMLATVNIFTLAFAIVYTRISGRLSSQQAEPTPDVALA